MSTYNISPALNKNKVFLINLGELLGRLDPAYNIAIRNSDLRTKYPTEQIGKLVKSFSGGTPSKANAEYWEGNILWASPKDFKNFYLTDTEDRISESALSDSSTTLAPADSLLIVVRSGVLIHTIPVAVTKLPMAINQDLKALIPDDRILPEYLGIYFKIYNDKLLPLIVKHSTTVQSINTEQFEKLKIPIPPKNIQQQIIAIYGKALQINKQNEAETEKLLASIDDYLLKELGINLPEPPANTLENRMFTVQISDVSGGRLDPFFHQTYFNALIKALNNSKFSKSILGNAIANISYGASLNNLYVDDGVPILRIKDLKRNSISIDQVVYLPESTRPQIGNCFVKENDFLISRSGTIGVVALVPKEIDGFAFGSFMIKFSLKESAIINKKYLSFFLNSKLISTLIERNKIGAIQGNITIPTIKAIPLVLPPIEKQQEITDHITGIRQQAQQLKEKTKEALSKASQEIEKILLA